MQVRYATEKDLVPLARLCRLEIEFLQSHAGYYKLREDYDWASFVRKRLGNNRSRIFVANERGSLLGYIYVRVLHIPPKPPGKSLLTRLRIRRNNASSFPIETLRIGVIEDCYVLPEFQRRGIGSDLVGSAMSWLKVKKVKRVEIAVISANRSAVEFWQRAGFETFRQSMTRDI